MFCSTIIPTIARPSLQRSVQSLLDQDFSSDNYEIIIVNDSGKSLELSNWKQYENIRIINTNQHDCCIARNCGAAISNGDYLHFLDDDDWLAPNFLSTLWELSQRSQAAMLFGAAQLVDGQGNHLKKLNHKLTGNCFIQVMAGEWIPLQASIIKKEVFFRIGGFNQLITGPGDSDLIRRIGLNYDLASTSEIVAYKVMNRSASTGDWAGYPFQSRWARELILDQPSVFNRLQDSILQCKSNRSYWYGKSVRLFLTSSYWNISNRRLFKSFSRFLFAIFNFCFSGYHIFSIEFWRAIFRPHISVPFWKKVSID